LAPHGDHDAPVGGDRLHGLGDKRLDDRVRTGRHVHRAPDRLGEDIAVDVFGNLRVRPATSAPVIADFVFPAVPQLQSSTSDRISLLSR
jgi:hypothetical protein